MAKKYSHLDAHRFHNCRSTKIKQLEDLNITDKDREIYSGHKVTTVNKRYTQKT
jgi:hypothetical protein